METRSCSNTHFIQAARNGLVMKVRNIDSIGKPALLFKNLKDIYEAEDTRRPGGPTSHSQGTCADEPPHLSVVDRILQETKPETDKMVPVGYDDEINSDLDDNTTLKQIRKRCKTRKRKLERFTDDSNQAEETKKLLEEGSDLNEPLISLKSKLSKNLKSKKKCAKRGMVASSGTSSSIKSEHDLVFPPSKQGLYDLPQFLPVKLEIPESEFLGLQRIALVDELSINHNVDLNNGVMASNETLKIVEPNSWELRTAEESEKCLTDKVSCEPLKHVEPISMLNTIDERGVRLENSKMSFQESLVMSPSEIDAGNIIEQEHSCGLPPIKDQVSDIFSHSSSFSDMEETSGKSSETSKVQADQSGINFQEFSVLSPPEIDTRSIIEQEYSCEILPGKYESLDTYSHSRSYSNIEEMCGQTIETSSVQVSDVTVDDDVGCLELHGVDIQPFGYKAEQGLPCKQDGLVTDPESHCSSSLEPDVSFEPDDHIVSAKDIISIEEQPSSSVIPRNGLHPRDHLDDELSISQEKKTLPIPITVGEKELHTNNQTCDVDETPLTSELHYPPERLLSTRKVISPSSQERLCLALNSVNLGSGVNHHKCKGKLLFIKQTENKSSSGESDIQNPKRTENHGGPVQVSQTKGTASPRRIFKKSQNGKGFLYKGNVENPTFSRAPPNLRTVCTSSKSCSESAIAFSEQQMHDTESLALKLLNELKSMKDVIEEKLLFEAYRNVSLKNDAEEVKAVINNATKVEETARKWLSMMTRDCNRFCKIMKLTEIKVPVSKNSVPREGKKIKFADEAGGELCHVKFIEDDMSSQVSDSKNE